MKKANFFLFIVMLILSATAVMAEEDREDKVPAGMEITEVGKIKFLVPQGAKFHKKGDLIILENADEYVARRLLDMEERLVKIEEKVEELNKKIEELNQASSKTQKDNLISVPSQNEWYEIGNFSVMAG